jgi:hypothetical protein
LSGSLIVGGLGLNRGSFYNTVDRGVPRRYH